jgi:phytoene dehydrogenase-like protein
MGGLTAGALLAKAGLDVCVLEMCSRPGGYLAGFRRGHFVFDTAIHWLNQCGPDGSVRRLLDLIGPGAPETPPLERIRRYKGDTFDYVLTSDPDLLRDALIRDFPAEAAGILRFFSEAKTVGEAFSKLCQKVRIPQTMSIVEKSKLGIEMLLISRTFWKYLSVAAEKGLLVGRGAWSDPRYGGGSFDCC